MSMSVYFLLLLIIAPLYILINYILRKRIGCDDSRPRPYVSGCIHKMRGHHGHVRK